MRFPLYKFLAINILLFCSAIHLSAQEDNSIDDVIVKADSLRSRSFYEQAIEEYERALTFLDLKSEINSPRVLRLRNNLGDCLIYTEDFDKGDSITKLNIQNNLMRSDPDTLALAFSIGLEAFNYYFLNRQISKKNRIEELLSMYQKAEDLLEQFDAKSKQEVWIYVLQNKCKSLARASLFKECVSCLKEIRERIDDHQIYDYKTEAAYESMLGYALMRISKDDLASNHLKKSIDIYKEHIGETVFPLFYPLKNYARILYKEGKYGESIEYRKQSIKIYKNRFNSYTKFLIQESLRLADLYITTQRTEKAIEIIEELQPHINQNLGTEFTFFNFIKARCQLYSNDFEGAINSFKKIIKKAEVTRVKYLVSSAKRNLARAYFNQGDYQKSFEISQDLISQSCNFKRHGVNTQFAIQSAVKLNDWTTASSLNIMNVSELDDPDLNVSITQELIKLTSSFRFYYNRYFKFKDSKDLNNALKFYRRIIAKEKSIYNDFFDSDSRTLFYNNLKFYHDEYLRVFYEAFKLTNNESFLIEASEFIDYQKSVTLQLKINRELTLRPSTISKIEKEEKKASIIYDKLPFLSGTEEEVLRSKLFNIKANIKDLKDHDFAHQEVFFEENMTFSEKLENVRDSSSAILQIYNGYKDYHFILHTVDSTQFNRLSHQTNLNQSLEKLISLSKSPELDSLTFYSKKVYQAILSSFDFNEKIRNITIIPDRLFSFIPFEILQDQKGNMLLEKFNIQISNSVQVLHNQKLKKPKETTHSISFAPSYDLRGQSKSQRDPHELLLREGNYNLPGAIQESKKMKKIIGAHVFNQSKASESSFKKIAKDYNLIHLAMHGSIDGEDDMRSKLWFSNLENDNQEDNFLHAYEIMNMNLNADLVVLGACNTGSGEFKHGGGVQSLANAFVYAGAANTVMSLWNVPDESSSKIMGSFYENIKNGQAVHTALSNAKRAYLQDETVSSNSKHPYYWAGFVVSGNMKALNFSSRNDHIIFFIFLIGIGFVLAIGKWKWKFDRQ